MQGHDEDKLGLADAIKAATISNAWLMGKEDVVFPQDPDET